MPLQSQTQRSLLYTFIASIGLCGLVGIYALLAGNFGNFEAKVLATTSSVGGAAILALAAAVPAEKRRWHPIGPLAIVVVAAALILVLCLIWIDRIWREEFFMKSLGIACVFAVALPLLGLLSLARLRKGLEWCRVLTVIAIGILAILLMLVIVFEPSGDDWVRMTGTLAILSVCGTIATPVLHRVSAIHDVHPIQTTALVLALTCPRCGKAQSLPAGRSKCASCGLKFNIEIEEEHCPKCGYALYKLTSANCPECGAPLAQPASPASGPG
jgi:ribosomal protein L37E